MAKRHKNYLLAKEKIEQKEYAVDEAFGLLKEVKSTRFDESVDIAIRLGVDPKYPDQMVRGTVVLPHGTGRVKRVLVIAAGEKQKEAEEAGADFVGGEEIVEKIKNENWFDFELLIATPDMMRHVGKLGKLLGPKGLMPSPKTGTVTFNIKESISDIKKGRVEFKVDKTGIINAAIGKSSFDTSDLVDNAREFVSAVLKAKPVSLKGRYVMSIYVSTTMSPSVKLNLQDFEK
ncbi:MAG: 50S ribosomal protein L1 [Candidatus Aminicenantes bacterium]|nr:50S ribosomal protein L1 [Candidatus Aminicenantes bacterium]NIM79789.1 50S ribosomal protein L1 [Candidatus Aminicenantes bacterium]NIN19117.1 50S ribosomal protein L1 [Candidatus Aminicenantes bacterium]NIN43019.1 50S ribosomal protein L1 [Candidatus Aminicenantes bacterium]NIN85762.1 50S ribosomal protein L1 [Candidatus Aminicenantes bacterium]